nr:alpha/beta hydrolases superfamily protein [Tanacetum cinerariifolium]
TTTSPTPPWCGCGGLSGSDRHHSGGFRRLTTPGVEGRLGKDYLKRIKQYGFTDVVNRKGNIEYRVTEESLMDHLTSNTDGGGGWASVSVVAVVVVLYMGEARDDEWDEGSGRSDWDKMIHTQCNARYEKLEKESQTKISELEECVRIKDRQHIIRASDDFIIFENLRAQVQELQSENEHLKSKVVDCTMCQNLEVQVEELRSVNESLNLLVEKLYKARVLAEVTLRERDELISA